MQDGLLVRVLHGLAYRNEKLHALPDGELSRIAIVCDGCALHQFHGEVWPSVVRGPGIEHGGDVRMIHQRQRLPLRLEPRDDLA